MFEVYTGARPGRPKLLLCLCAALLVVSFGVAWVQVRASRTLGPETRVAGTPLIVRPPQGWQADPKTPGLFYQAVRVEGRFGPKLNVKRQIHFRYQRWPAMQPVETLLRQRNRWDEVSAAGAREPARIGAFDGVQVRRIREFELLGEYHREETLYRLAMSPRGDEISVEYFPLRELTQGDLALLDEICAAVRLDGVSLDTNGALSQARAGLEFEVAANWRVFGADFAEVPGVYIQTSQNGAPTWGLGVFRTWLSPERGASELLADLAWEDWRTPREQVRISSTRTSDGTISVLHGMEPSEAGAMMTAVRLVESSQTRAAMIFTFSAGRHFAAAEQAAAELAQTLRIRPEGFVDDIEGARRVGATLVRELQNGGIQQMWGQDEQVRFFGRADTPAVLIRDGRAPSGAGYCGNVTYVFAGVDAGRRIEWTVGRDGLAYTWQMEELDERGNLERVRDRREGAQSGVVRTRDTGATPRSVSYAVGARFVNPPLEELSELWVSRQESGWWELEVMTKLPGGTHARLMRPMSAPGSGRSAVLLLEDYDPRGIVVSFDALGKLSEDHAAVGRIARMDESEAGELGRSWQH